MGSRGPVGKRPDMKHGHRSAAELAGFDEIEPQSVTWPEPDDGWHPAMVRWYRSIAESAQAGFLQQTDVEVARVMAEMVSRQLHSDRPINSQIMRAFLSAHGDLLGSAGSRRKLRLELGRPDDAIGSARLAAVQSLAERRPGDNGA